MTTMGICGLCKTENELMKSHLIPDAMYRILMQEIYPNKKVNCLVHENYLNGNAIATSKQVRAYFLCDDCEQLFNKNGEKLMAESCFKGSNNFAILDQLNQLTPFYSNQDTHIFNFDNIKDWEKYLYFAVSIIWRASEGRWADKRIKTENSLDKKAEEVFRDFLLQKTSVLKNVLLIIYIDSDPKPKNICLAFPKLDNNVKEMLKYHFTIPGIMFELHIKEVNENAKVLFCKTPYEKSPTYDGMVNKIKNLEPKGKKLIELTKKNEQK